MEEKELKTSLKQRIFIVVIAVIMLGSIIASYAAIVLAGNSSTSSSDTSTISDEKIAEYESLYEEKKAVFAEKSQGDFAEFVQYKTNVKGYNEISANENGVQTSDLKVGDGRELTEDDTDYLAYYIGWCADETVFDSSFDDLDNPTSLTGALDPASGLIEGWHVGVEGMKLGGVREITVPGELAYGDTQEICGGYSKPLKFIVMAVANEGDLATAANELNEAMMKYQYAVYYGIDYDSLSE